MSPRVARGRASRGDYEHRFSSWRWSGACSTPFLRRRVNTTTNNRGGRGRRARDPQPTASSEGSAAQTKDGDHRYPTSGVPRARPTASAQAPRLSFANRRPHNSGRGGRKAGDKGRTRRRDRRNQSQRANQHNETRNLRLLTDTKMYVIFSVMKEGEQEERHHNSSLGSKR